MTPNWAAKVVRAALFFAIAALLLCALSMSRAGCPACLPEFASNGVKLDVLTLELPANGNELRRVLYLGKPFSRAVRDVYGEQMMVDDVFLWLYPAQFVLACFYFALICEARRSRLLLLAASLLMIWTGWLDHGENSIIHAILSDSGSRFNQLAPAVAHVSLEKWLCFGAAAFLAAAGLLLLRIGGIPSLTGYAAVVICAALLSTFLLIILGWTIRSRNIIGWSAVVYSIFPLALLWMLYLKPWAERLDGWLRTRLGPPRRTSS